MIRLHTASRLVRGACVVAVPVFCSGALAAGASAASLKVSVPSHVKLNHVYAIQLDGRFKNADLTGTAFLISVIQYSHAPCMATAQLESRSGHTLQFYFAPARHPSRVGIFERRSPFTRRDGFTAKVLGTRRVCAYLYPQQIGPSSTIQPIATASSKVTVRK